MPRTSISHQDHTLSDCVLSEKAARVDVVLVVNAAADGVALDESDAHALAFLSCASVSFSEDGGKYMCSFMCSQRVGLRELQALWC